MWGLERREDVEIADVHSSDAVVAGSVIQDILMRCLMLNKCYKCEDVLVFLFLLEALVRA